MEAKKTKKPRSRWQNQPIECRCDLLAAEKEKHQSGQQKSECSDMA